jgi:hypothetical protein
MKDSNGIEVKVGDEVRSTEGFIYEVIEHQNGRWGIAPIYGPGCVIDLKYIGSFEIVDGSLRQDAAKYRELKDSHYVKLVEAVKRLYAENDPIMMPEITLQVEIMLSHVDQIIDGALQTLNTLLETS